MNTDETYMQRALELARRGLVLAAPPVAPREHELPVTTKAASQVAQYDQPVNENPE